MKYLFIIGILFSISQSFAQWTYEKVSNDFDEPYRIAYTTKSNGAILKLEDLNGDIVFYIQGGYYCEDYPSVDLVFVINGENKKFTIEGFTNDAGDCIFFTTNLTETFLAEPFQKCSVLKIRINETYCDSEIYSFNMSKSTSALSFMQSK